MFKSVPMMQMARDLGLHVQKRQLAAVSNVANADTPGFHAKDLQPFEQGYSRQASALRTTLPGHIESPSWSPATLREVEVDADHSPNGNAVSLEDEMVRAADIKRQHDMSLAIYRSGLNLMRISLGKR